MKIPWAKPYIGKEELEEIVDSVKSKWVTMGAKVEKFEKEVAKYVGVKHGIAVSSGTAALDVALKAIGIKERDEVIIPAMTYIATANAVLYQHAKPVLADIEPRTYNVNAHEVLEKITSKTKCIIPIDYGGQCADYDALREIAEDHNIYLVEDGAESLGAEYKGRKACSFGEINTTSFHAAKVITSVEGGMVLTDDDEMARRARIIRNQGEDPGRKYYHVMLGHNYRMSDLHAAIGLAQFRRIEDVLRKRAEIAEYYTRNLEEYSDVVTLPYVAPWNKHAWFFYPILIENRDKVEKYLNEHGIGTRVAWFLPIHKQPIYRDLFKDAKYPIAEKFSKGVLNLPMYYEMTKEEQDYVIMHRKEAIEKFGGRKYELE